ncbi:hypothetical protein DESUT3_40910 [Desulfuromonas versatilis]|uniref:Response regulatory domain-containing protein n=1 Tax=Desulfuromonas versatilis TaxID=2802975 RepID=A0ABM8HVU6_9BACT|nr:response regulator [Desulfuromonas versatilis]BCR07022.1 hypothetical protein DESUT3_40910 [Desulfuromonas versatilis]
MVARNKKILVADDHLTSIMYQSILLGRLGYEVVPAFSGREVLEQLEAARPDLVLLASNLPEMDGLLTLKTLRGHSRGAKVPVIIVAESHSEAYQRQAEAAGCSGYLAKPIGIKALNAVLQQALFAEGLVRSNLRVPLAQQVEIRHGEELGHYRGVALSEGGLFVLSAEPLPVGSQVRVGLQLSSDCRLELAGRVIYHQGFGAERRDPEQGMAIAFQDPDEAALASLRRHIRAILAGDLTGGEDGQVFFREP